MRVDTCADGRFWVDGTGGVVANGEVEVVIALAGKDERRKRAPARGGNVLASNCEEMQDVDLEAVGRTGIALPSTPADGATAGSPAGGGLGGAGEDAGALVGFHSCASFFACAMSPRVICEAMESRALAAFFCSWVLDAG